MSAPSPVRDPALGLLDRLVRDALDPGYRAATLARGDDARAGSPRRHWGAGAGLLLVAAVLTVGLVVHLVGAPDAAARKKDLATTIATATSEVELLENQVRDVTAQVDRLQSQALGSDRVGAELKADLARLGPSVGVSAVTGPGIVVTLDDAVTDDSAVGDPELGRVLDRDLQLVVNGLWEAGAEAVAVNGQRITALTAIRGAGGAILVNYRPLVPPYVASAIGGPGQLSGDFAASSAGAELAALHQTYGLRYDVREVDAVTLPGEAGVSLRTAKVVRE